MDGNDLVANFISDITWAALPKEVQRKAKWCLQDALGATIGGTLTTVSKLTATYVAEAWPGDDATILLYDRRSSAAGAAFANGCAANGLDIDDGAKYTRGHPGAQLFAASLALSEKVGASGEQMLTAMVAGYEVAHRAGRCWHDHHEIYQACGSWGSMACAAAAAKLMMLNSEQVKHALGIAEYHAPNLPMMRDIDHPAMVKHGVGWGAMTGIISAELAARGFTGIPSISGFEEYEDWVSTIGKEYIMVEGVAFKQYASCAWGHPAFAATLKLVHEHNIEVEEIEKIRVEGFHEMTCLQIKQPKTEEEAQFSLAWPLAALLIDGEVGPDQMLPHRYGDERFLALADRVELVESKEIDELSHPKTRGGEERFLGAVEITLKDGQRFHSGIMEREVGSAGSWDEEKLEKKFRWISGHVLDGKRVDELVDLLRGFENLSSVNELTRLLRQPQIEYGESRWNLDGLEEKRK